MYGKAHYDFVRVIEAAEYAGEHWLQVHCGETYEEFAALPTVIEFQGRMYGKMSWNSDTRKAAYKVGAPVARIVKEKGRTHD